MAYASGDSATTGSIVVGMVCQTSRLGCNGDDEHATSSLCAQMNALRVPESLRVVPSPDMDMTVAQGH